MIKYRKKLLIFHLSPIRYRYIETPISKVPIRYRYSDIGDISTIFSLYRPTSESYTRQSAGDSRSSTIEHCEALNAVSTFGHPRSVIYVGVYVPSYITRRALYIKAAMDAMTGTVLNAFLSTPCQQTLRLSLSVRDIVLEGGESRLNK